MKLIGLKDKCSKIIDKVKFKASVLRDVCEVVSLKAKNALNILLGVYAFGIEALPAIILFGGLGMLATSGVFPALKVPGLITLFGGGLFLYAAAQSDADFDIDYDYKENAIERAERNEKAQEILQSIKDRIAERRSQTKVVPPIKEYDITPVQADVVVDPEIAITQNNNLETKRNK